MSRPMRRLDSLLRVRRLQEELAKLELAAAQQRQHETQTRVEQATLTYRSTRGDQGELRAGQFLRQRALAAAAAKDLGLAQGERAQAVAETDQTRWMVHQAAQRSEGLQRLVDRAEQLHRRAVAAAEQRVVDNRGRRSIKGSRTPRRADPSRTPSTTEATEDRS